MRTFLLAMLVCFPLTMAPGCGSDRPDPRENPEFDEESYQDVDALDMDPKGVNN